MPPTQSIRTSEITAKFTIQSAFKSIALNGYVRRFSIAVFVFTAVIFLSRSAQASETSYCLNYQYSDSEATWTLNPTTGMTTSVHPLFSQNVSLNGVKSPDGHFVAYNDETESSSLFISPTRSYQPRKIADSAGALAWSPDSTQLFYTTSEANVSDFLDSVFVINADGSEKRLVVSFIPPKMPDVPYPEMRPEDPLNMHYWSADGLYFAFSYQEESHTTLAFWSRLSNGLITFPVHPLSPDTQDTRVPRTEWSHSGHLLAAATSDGKHKWLDIISPARGLLAETQLPPETFLGAEYEFYHPQISWSGDDSYLAIRNFTDSYHQAALEVYETSRLRLLGETIDGLNGGDLDPQLDLHMKWIGPRLYFWQLQHESELISYNNYVVFDTNTRTFRTLVDHIEESGTLPGLPYYVAWGNTPSGKIAVWRYTSRGGLTPLLTGIDEMLYSHPTYRHPFFLSADDSEYAHLQVFAVIWATGKDGTAERRSHLSIFNLDGGPRYDIQAQSNQIASLDWQGRWLGYLVEREQPIRAETRLLDMVSGKTYHLGDVDFGDYADWFSVSPDNRQAAVWSLERGIPELRFIALDGKATVRRLISGASRGVWSPDSRLFAFTTTAQDQPKYLFIVDNSGKEKLRIVEPGFLYNIEWVSCS